VGAGSAHDAGCSISPRTDANGDQISFFAQSVGGTGLPAGAQIDDHRAGMASFQWQPSVAAEGLYPLRVAAFDEGGGAVGPHKNRLVVSQATILNASPLLCSGTSCSPRNASSA